MHERAEQSPFAIHFEITRCPDCRRSDITGKNCVLAGELAHRASDKLGMTSFALASFSCQFVQGFPRFAIMLEACLQVRVITVLFQLRQKSLECHFGIADQPVVELGATAELFSANVDLDNGCALWKKLLIREIGA